MKKASSISLFLYALLLIFTVSAYGGDSSNPKNQPAAALDQGTEKTAGLVKLVVTKSKTICIDVPDKGQMIFSITGDTKFENATSQKDIQPEQKIAVQFVKSGAINIAKVVTRLLTKLPDGVRQVSTDEMKEISNKINPSTGVILYDARPLASYDQSHIPGALSLPSPESNNEENERKLAAQLPKDKTRPLIFYCVGPTRGFAATAAGVALKNGHSDLKVYYDGYQGWQNADMPFAASPKFVKEGGILLIDLRQAKDYGAGHIPGALNIPSEKFLTMTEKTLPDYRETPMVFYGSQQADINSAIELVRDLSFTKTTFFPGGAERWKKIGYQLETGSRAVPEKLSYSRKLAPYEVSIADFKKALEGKTAMIIDARTKDEFIAGNFKGALNIPFDSIEGRYTEIPRDRPVYVHCANGSRAAIAYETLREKGYSNVRLLRATISFTDGKQTITD